MLIPSIFSSITGNVFLGELFYSVPLNAWFYLFYRFQCPSKCTILPPDSDLCFVPIGAEFYILLVLFTSKICFLPHCLSLGRATSCLVHYFTFSFLVHGFTCFITANVSLSVQYCCLILLFYFVTFSIKFKTL